MQGVILAAGKSTRTFPLTASAPKPLLKAANKTILEHNLEALEGIADEVVIVVGYKKEKIISFIESIKGRLSYSVRFAEQKEQLGTGHATLILEHAIRDRFLLIMGDNIYCHDDLKECSAHKYSMLVAKVNNPEIFGAVTEKDGILADMVEKPNTFVSGLVNCAAYSLDRKIFRMLKKTKISCRSEIEITDAIMLLKEEEDISCVKSREWIPIGYPWDLLCADKLLRKGKSMIGRCSCISGNVENSSIGDNCKISGKVYDSLIMDNCIVEGGSEIRDSVLADNVHFSGTALSGDNVKSKVNGNDVTVTRMGAVLADNVIADNVLLKPGCKIWPGRVVTGKISGDVV